MPDDIGFVEVEESDARDILEGRGGFGQAAVFIAGEVDLGKVAGDGAFGVRAQAGQEHEHLFGRGILGFVENDKRASESSSAHISEGSDFDNPFIDIALGFLEVHEIAEGIVERTQVGEDFFGEVAGEKPEGFPRFDGRTSEDDAFDFFLFESFYGEGDGEVSFSGSCGAEAESDIVRADGLDVAALTIGAGRDGRFILGAVDFGKKELGEIAGDALGCGAEEVEKFLFTDFETCSGGGGKLVKNDLGGGDSCAIDTQPSIAGSDNDGELLFQLPEQAFIIGEKTVQSTGVFRLDRERLHQEKIAFGVRLGGSRGGASEIHRREPSACVRTEIFRP